ncbi:tapasin-related protein-like [Synchiropus picturatus]
MSLAFKLFVYLCYCAGVQCIHHLTWLPCKFTDERMFVNTEGQHETELQHRDSMLQFGKAGDPPVNPQAVTFLATGSKLELRRYLDSAGADNLDCELRRFRTENTSVLWPGLDPQEFSSWFKCTLKHTKELFTVVAFLRFPSSLPPAGEDHRNWPAISDGQMLTTTVTMVMKTETPLVQKGLGLPVTLHCQFVVDHKRPKVSVEWILQRRGERRKLFSSGETEGTGVDRKSLSRGVASYEVPYTKINLEGTYMCSVSVAPLSGTVDVGLQMFEAPRVSLSVTSPVIVPEGSEHKFSCQAENYYPLDVEFTWTETDPAVSAQRVGAPLPKTLKNVLLSSHRNNAGGTYTLSAFFYIQATRQHSGKQFTCIVNHKLQRLPIKKNFVLIVEEPSSWGFYLVVTVILLSSLGLLFIMLPYLYQGESSTVLF